MAKFTRCYVGLAVVAFSTAVFAGQPHSGALSVQNSGPAPITVAQVGIGTPACHIQGTLWRMANNCPPEAVAEARQHHPIKTYRNPPDRRYSSRWQNRHHRRATAFQTVHPN
jgi:hypothetical protein